MIETTKSWSQHLLGIVLGALFAGTALADPTDFGESDAATNTIEFVEDNDLGGRTARFEGTISDRGQRLVVKGLDVMSPLVVRIFAKDVSKPVDVSLHRYVWGKADAEGSTGSSGDWEYRGRANDEIGIALSVAESTPVYALIWQGPPVPAALPPTIVIDSEGRAGAAGDSGGTSVMTIAIVGLLFVIALLLAMMVFRGRRSASAALLVAGLLALSAPDRPAFAASDEEPPPNPFADEEPKQSPEEVPNPFVDDSEKSPGDDFKPEDSGDKPDGSADGDSKLKPDQAGDKPETGNDGDSKLKPDQAGDKPETGNDGDSKLKPDQAGDKSDAGNDGDSKLKPDQAGNKPEAGNDGDSKLKPDPDSDKPRDGDSKLKPDPDSNKPRDGDSKLKPDPDSNKPRDGSSKLEPDPDADKPGDTDHGVHVARR